MANDTTREPHRPKRYRHLPTVVEGIVYDGTVDCARAIVDWGRLRTGNEPFTIEGDDLHAYTPQGLRYVPEGDMAVLGVLGEPYSVQPQVCALAYTAVNGADYRAPLTAERVQEIRDEAQRTADPGRLRELVDQLVAHSEALGA